MSNGEQSPNISHPSWPGQRRPYGAGGSALACWNLCQPGSYLIRPALGCRIHPGANATYSNSKMFMQVNVKLVNTLTKNISNYFETQIPSPQSTVMQRHGVRQWHECWACHCTQLDWQEHTHCEATRGSRGGHQEPQVPLHLELWHLSCNVWGVTEWWQHELTTTWLDCLCLQLQESGRTLHHLNSDLKRIT